MTIPAIAVANDTQLSATLKFSSSDETIMLAVGKYGVLTFVKFNFASDVTIKGGGGGGSTVSRRVRPRVRAKLCGSVG